jgi:mannose-1-phosphate guanylyltransferase
MIPSPDHTYAIVMAGGVGSRFWPKSRESKPKQYLSLVDDGSLIQNTTARLRGLFSNNNTVIVSTHHQKALLQAQLPWLPLENIIFEPMGRNTAPAIGLAAIHLLDIDAEATMVVLPADHRIANTGLFQDTLRTALATISKNSDALVTLGIKPSYPATGYGYIKAGSALENGVYRVAQFIEKPNRARAEDFIRSGDYFWNSGMFIWRADAIIKQIKEYMPNLYAGLERVRSVLHSDEYDAVCAKVYAPINGQSIDYGVIEKAECVYMVQAEFDWSDLGTWEEVYKNSPKDEFANAIVGQPLVKDVTNSYIESSERTVCVIGVDGLVIVDQPDALLICNKERSQEVRWVTKKLREPSEKDNS